MVECVPESRMEEEVLFWIGREDFFRWFDQEDFHCRDRQDVKDLYLTDWFSLRDGDRLPKFEAPAVRFFNGKTQFFSGRHRTEVLFKFLDAIPFALRPISDKEIWAFAETHQDESIRLFESLPKRPCMASDRLFVPDLPIWSVLPEDEIGAHNPILLSRWAADPNVREEMACEEVAANPGRVTVDVQQGDGSFSICIKQLS